MTLRTNAIRPYITNFTKIVRESKILGFYRQTNTETCQF
jgi:hypothetical protein